MRNQHSYLLRSGGSSAIEVSYLQSFVRFINRRHVYTKQAEIYQSPACICNQNTYPARLIEKTSHGPVHLIVALRLKPNSSPSSPRETASFCSVHRSAQRRIIRKITLSHFYNLRLLTDAVAGADSVDNCFEF